MTDPTLGELAHQAIFLLTPVLHPIAEGFLKQPGAKLFDWLTAQFKGKPAQSTLDHAAANPQPAQLDNLRFEIEKRAREDAEFRAQLSELVQPAITAIQTLHVTGDINKSAQAAGSNIQIKIK